MKTYQLLIKTIFLSLILIVGTYGIISLNNLRNTKHPIINNVNIDATIYNDASIQVKQQINYNNNRPSYGYLKIPVRGFLTMDNLKIISDGMYLEEFSTNTCLNDTLPKETYCSTLSKDYYLVKYKLTNLSYTISYEINKDIITAYQDYAQFKYNFLIKDTLNEIDKLTINIKLPTLPATLKKDIHVAHADNDNIKITKQNQQVIYQSYNSSNSLNIDILFPSIYITNENNSKDEILKDFITNDQSIITKLNQNKAKLSLIKNILLLSIFSINIIILIIYRNTYKKELNKLLPKEMIIDNSIGFVAAYTTYNLKKNSNINPLLNALLYNLIDLNIIKIDGFKTNTSFIIGKLPQSNIDEHSLLMYKCLFEEHQGTRYNLYELIEVLTSDKAKELVSSLKKAIKLEYEKNTSPKMIKLKLNTKILIILSIFITIITTIIGQTTPFYLYSIILIVISLNLNLNHNINIYNNETINNHKMWHAVSNYLNTMNILPNTDLTYLNNKTYYLSYAIMMNKDLNTLTELNKIVCNDENNIYILTYIVNNTFSKKIIKLSK